MSYPRAIASLNTLHPLGIRPGLERIRALLKALGNPERGMKVIHVAGSNGKGSVCRMIESVLIENGLRTGMFISPHLVDFRERFRINGSMASKAEVAKAWPALKRALKKPAVLKHGPPTFFEAVTALAFLIFKRQRCEILVLETGLGGRFDSTNVIRKPLMTVITNISLEHTQILGKTEAKIAWEKAGILKAGSPLVTAAAGKALKVILETKRLVDRMGAVSAPGRRASDSVALREGKNWRVLRSRQQTDSPSGQSLEIEVLGKRRWVFIPLLGEHQRVNLACALAALDSLKLPISEAALIRGLACAHWSGRMQLISRRPLTLIDGAHNPAGAAALSRSVRAMGPKRAFFVAGVLRDKDWKSMFREFNKTASCYFLARPEDERGLDPLEIVQWLKGRSWPSSKVAVFKSPKAALRAARKLAKKGDLVMACGSLYTVGAILAASLKGAGGR